MRTVTAVVGVTLLLAGCAEEPAKETTGTSGTAWEGPPAADESGSIPVDTFNAFLETADPRLSTSPIRAAVEFVGYGEPLALTTRVEDSYGSRVASTSSSRVPSATSTASTRPARKTSTNARSRTRQNGLVSGRS